MVQFHEFVRNDRCSFLNLKLQTYNIYNNNYDVQQKFHGLRLCRGFIDNQCCPSSIENNIKNATALELYRLFELNSIIVYDSLLRYSTELNDTIKQLLQSSRQETHLVLQRGYNNLYEMYRQSIDDFYNSLNIITARTKNDISLYVEQLFRSVLKTSFSVTVTGKINDVNLQPSIKTSYLTCVWQTRPFGDISTTLTSQISKNLGSILDLYELLKTVSELVQLISIGITTDYHCIDLMTQLNYCNLCAGRNELPCYSSCKNVILSCLSNITRIDNTWNKFVDSIQNVQYFNGLENVLSSIGISISEAVMTFFNAGGVENKEIIRQCGRLSTNRILKRTTSIENNMSNKSIFKPINVISLNNDVTTSSFHKKLMMISRSFSVHQSFWSTLPDSICTTPGVSVINTTCWTGTTVSIDGRSQMKSHFDKPLSLRLQWLLNEIEKKSAIFDQTEYSQNAAAVFTLKNDTKLNMFSITTLLNDTHDSLNDDQQEDELDYADYAYEDEESTTSRKTTIVSTTTKKTTLQILSFVTTTKTSLSIYPLEHDSEDDNTDAYYDYDDSHDKEDDDHDYHEYSDENFSTYPPPLIKPTTNTNWRKNIPNHHRTPIVWTFDNSLKKNSNSLFSYSKTLFFTNFISVVFVQLKVL
ncbi:unnamed protein product [Didymodactylos carnosus]|uniref:Uncharacterized protein n=1 Tax=Didymodactylos carnosus TaxID=1234261 RepID=A0A8S2CNS6_9BILA|nr:unnamed protein product [Didymodactylos carnosus]CAF3541472.1 unnamed protein product [Didymodactylos carnosus]